MRYLLLGDLDVGGNSGEARMKADGQEAQQIGSTRRFLTQGTPGASVISTGLGRVRFQQPNGSEVWSCANSPDWDFVSSC